MRRASLLALVLTAACSSSSPPPPTPVGNEAAAPAVTSRARIDIRPLTITFQGHPIARLMADGRTESVANNTPGPDATFVPGPTLREDGTITLTKAGFTARIDDAGDIYVVSPPDQNPREHLFGRIDGTRLTIGAGGGMRVDDATIVYDREGGPEIGVITGPVDDRARRTALVMTAVFFIDMVIAPR